MNSVTEHLQSGFKKHDIKLYLKARYIVRNVVVIPKDPFVMCEQCGVIYECECEVCSKLYMGETWGDP